MLPDWWPGCDGRDTCDYMQFGWDLKAKQSTWQHACDERAVAFHDNPANRENDTPLCACMWHAPCMADLLAAWHRNERIQES